ncbi:MAG TPA: hypothetical protein ENJ88_04240 [Phaeodactylibacter sp.]|nr:hypothetical protein [Phaeodactylibacter sp.]
MKANWKIIALFFGATVLAFTACRPEDTTPEPEAKVASEEDVVDMIEGSVSDETGGLEQEVAEMATIADDYVYKGLLDTPCEEERDTSFTYDYQGNLVSASYATNSTFILHCNDVDFPVAMDFTTSTTGTYTTPRIVSSDSGSSAWNVDNLLNGTDYIVNGTYQRSGTQESQVGNQYTFNSTLDFELENLNINKGNYQIDSGMATFTITAEVEGGESRTFEGTIVFLGNQAADVIINGTTYPIEW